MPFEAQAAASLPRCLGSAAQDDATREDLSAKAALKPRVQTSMAICCLTSLTIALFKLAAMAMSNSVALLFLTGGQRRCPHRRSLRCRGGGYAGSVLERSVRLPVDADDKRRSMTPKGHFVLSHEVIAPA